MNGRGTYTRLLVNVLLVSELGLSGCAASGGRSELGPGSAAGTIIVAAAGATAEQQLDSCDGLGSPTQLFRFTTRPDVVTVVACASATMQPFVSRKASPVAAANVLAFADALAGPDTTARHWFGQGACDSRVELMTSFAVELADGSKLRPAVPLDQCGHPSSAVLDALGTITGTP